MKITDIIRKQLAENPIILYMKGNPDFPMCGFSGSVVSVLKRHTDEFSYVDVLENPRIRQALPEVSDWPTFPQLFVNGELVGGADIVTEMDKAGELKALLDTAKPVSEVVG